MKKLIYVVALVGIVMLLVWGICDGIDKSVANQDMMLCESALYSGNQEYLDKCECYYQSEDINCVK